jgi:hypothetical protein
VPHDQKVPAGLLVDDDAGEEFAALRDAREEPAFVEFTGGPEDDLVRLECSRGQIAGMWLLEDTAGF